MMSAGRELLTQAQALNANHALQLLTPAAPTRVWDAGKEAYVTTTGEPTVVWEGMGSLQPYLTRASDPPAERAGVPEDAPTYRAYLPYTAGAALKQAGVYLLDVDAESNTQNQAFQLLSPPVMMGGKGMYRLELREVNA